MKSQFIVLVLFVSCFANDILPHYSYLHNTYKRLLNTRTFQPLQDGGGQCESIAMFETSQLDSLCNSDCIKWSKDVGSDLDGCLSDSPTDKCLQIIKDMNSKCSAFNDLFGTKSPCESKLTQKDCCSDTKCRWQSQPLDVSTDTGSGSGTSSGSGPGMAQMLGMMCVKSNNKYCMPLLSSLGPNECSSNPSYDFDIICGGCIDSIMDVMKDPSMAASIKPFCMKDGSRYCFQDYVNNDNATDFIMAPSTIKQKCEAPCPPNLVFNQIATNSRAMAQKETSNKKQGMMDDADNMAAFAQLICSKENNDYCLAKIMQTMGKTEGCTACSSTCCHLCPAEPNKCPSPCELSDNECSRAITCDTLSSLTTSVSQCCLATLLGTMKKVSPKDYATITGKFKKCTNIKAPPEVCSAAGKKIAKSVVIKGKCAIVTAKKDKYVGPVTKDLEFNFKCTNCVKDVTFACYKPSQGKIQILQSSTDTSVSFNIQGVTDAQSDSISSTADSVIKANQLKTVETTATLNSDGANTASKSSSMTLIPYLTSVLILAGLAVAINI